MLSFWLLFCFFSLFSIIIIVPPIISLAIRKNLFDIPNKIKIHKKPIPRIGGVSIFISFLFAQILLFFFPQKDLFLSTTNSNLLNIYISSALFFFLGLYDDLYKINALKRLFLQFLISSFTWSQGIAITSLNFPLLIPNNYSFVLPNFLSFIITIIFITGIVNAINWSDGLDGLASGILFFSSIALTFISFKNGQIAIAILLLLMALNCLGFLFYNSYPAKIFLGDSGTYFLGFNIACFSLIGLNPYIELSNNGYNLNLFILLLNLIFPIFDMVQVIIKRILRKKSPFKGDRNHIHYLLIDNVGLSHRKTVFLIYIISFISSVCSYLLFLKLI